LLHAHLENAILLFADEAFWAQDWLGEGALKMLTSSVLTLYM